MDFNKNIENVGWYSQKVIPLVFDDSLSYYEQICKFAYSLNEVINQINSLTQEMKRYEDKLNTDFNTFKDTINQNFTDYTNNLNQEWVNYQTLMNQNFNNLKNYVDNFLDTLDITQEVSNKINQMYTDGTLANIINQDIFNELNTKVETNTTDISNLKTAVSTNTIDISNLKTKSQAQANEISQINNSISQLQEEDNLINTKISKLQGSNIISEELTLFPSNNNTTTQPKEIAFTLNDSEEYNYLKIRYKTQNTSPIEEITIPLKDLGRAYITKSSQTDSQVGNEAVLQNIINRLQINLTKNGNNISITTIELIPYELNMGIDNFINQNPTGNNNSIQIHTAGFKNFYLLVEEIIPL